jgi:hypothetical protein
MVVNQAVYRVRQFFGSVLARMSAAELDQADAYLSPAGRKLFRQMSAADQRHSLAVMRELEQCGDAHPSLLAAALLHDVGKSAARLTPVHRTIVVLAQRFWPAALAWLAREPAPAWRKPFVVQCRHPKLGAQWAEQAGCDAISVALIRRHQEHVGQPQNEVEELLHRLQRADKNN